MTRTVIIANGPLHGVEALGARGNRYLFMRLDTYDDARRTRGMSVDDIVWLAPPRDADDVYAAILPRMTATPGPAPVMHTVVRHRR